VGDADRCVGSHVIGARIQEDVSVVYRVFKRLRGISLKKEQTACTFNAVYKRVRRAPPLAENSLSARTGSSPDTVGFVDDPTGSSPSRKTPIAPSLQIIERPGPSHPLYSLLNPADVPGEQGKRYTFLTRPSGV
jgi:hypothetical protein